MSIKEEARRTAITVFSVLLIFVPVTVWEHGGSLTGSDICRIVTVPFLWYFCDVYVWPRFFKRDKRY